MVFKTKENTLIHILGTSSRHCLSTIAQIFIIYHELEHLYLDTVTDMNETLNTVPGDNSDADNDLGFEKNIHNELSDYEILHIPIDLTLSEEFLKGFYWKREGKIFQRMQHYFYAKIKLTSEIFNGKKFYKQKCFSLS